MSDLPPQGARDALTPALPPSTSTAGAEAAPGEATVLHTRLLRCGLSVEDARAYWAIPDPGPPTERVDRAFREFWFGARSHARVETVLGDLRVRFDAFPEALSVLRAWSAMPGTPEPTTRVLLCHWHLQLADPLYRRFTGEFLPARRAADQPFVNLPRVVAWVDAQDPGRWTVSTRRKFASALLTAAHEAGLVSTRLDPRPLAVPRVPDAALLYLLHLLHSVAFAGTFLDNPYLASVGLSLVQDGAALSSRLHALPGVTWSRQGALVDLSFTHPSLSSWFSATLSASQAEGDA